MNEEKLKWAKDRLGELLTDFRNKEVGFTLSKVESLASLQVAIIEAILEGSESL